MQAILVYKYIPANEFDISTVKQERVKAKKDAKKDAKPDANLVSVHHVLDCGHNASFRWT